MRSLWLSLSLLFLIVAFTAVDTAVLTNGIRAMEDEYSVLSATDVRDADPHIQRVEQVFRRLRPLFSISISMETVDGMENALILLRRAVLDKDEGAYASALSALEYALYRLRDATVPAPETVF